MKEVVDRMFFLVGFTSPHRNRDGLDHFPMLKSPRLPSDSAKNGRLRVVKGDVHFLPNSGELRKIKVVTLFILEKEIIRVGLIARRFL